MNSARRWLHAGVAWLFVLTILVQVFLAGAAIANLGGSGDFSMHSGFGFAVVGLASLALLLTALIAGEGRGQVGLSFGLLVLYIVQTSLPSFRSTTPALAALHPVNALLLFGLAVVVARRALRAAREPDVAKAEARVGETTVDAV
jgi:hypothetical protein